MRIKADCSHAEDIHALAASPLVLCMEGMEPSRHHTVRLTTDLEDGNQLLFRFDPEERQAEYVKTVTVEDGEIAFTLDEGGDYFIARRALAGSLNDPDTEEEQQVIAAETEEFGTPTPWDETAETVGPVQARQRPIRWGLPLELQRLVWQQRGRFIYKKEKREKTVRRKRRAFWSPLLLILGSGVQRLPDRSRTGGSDAVGKQGQERPLTAAAGTSRETQKEEEYIDEAM